MKAYTDLEQSCKLVKILPFKSADMYIDTTITPYFIGFIREDAPRPVTINDLISNNGIYPCWSLAALLAVYPMIVGRDMDMFCCWQNSKGLHSRHYDNPVDACYEMILKLHELKAL